MNRLYLVPIHTTAEILDDSRAILEYMTAQNKDLSDEQIRDGCSLTWRRWNQARVALMDKRLIGLVVQGHKYCVVRKEIIDVEAR